MRFQRICTRLHAVIPPSRSSVRWRSTSAALLDVLRRNKELSAEDAANELRWIRQAVREDPALRSSDVERRDDETVLLQLVQRRATGEPLQYVLGTTDFGPLMLRTRAPVLIPRPETAHVTERFAQQLLGKSSQASSPLDVLDLCTGSGCIALLLKHHLKDAINITGRDISQAALSLARENAGSIGTDVGFVYGDIWDRTEEWGRVDVLVSNPPYIPRSEWDDLQAGVKDFEDPAALVGDPNDLPSSAIEATAMIHREYEDSDRSGLAFYRRIADILPTILTPRADLEAKAWRGIPRVALEIGYNQAEQVQTILQQRSGGLIKRTEVWKDQYDVDRMIVGW